MPDGRYRASYVHPAPAGARYTAPCTFGAVDQARAWLRTEQELITAGGWTDPATRPAAATAGTGQPGGPPAFGVFAADYLNARAGLSTETRQAYTTVVHNHLIPAFGPLPLAQIDQGAVRAWWDSYGRRTPSARAAAYGLLKQVMDAAVAAGLAADNPCRAPHRHRRLPRFDPACVDTQR